jgi:hypothetical protein
MIPEVMDEADIDCVSLARRSVEMIEQLRDGDWDRLRSDWDDTMRERLPVEKLTEVWQQLLRDAGVLNDIGQPVVRQDGPYRIAETPLGFEHGQMKARVMFNRHSAVVGLFIVLPDAG